MLHNTYPLVTIGIPTYNRADGYLKNAIECALTQTYQNVEVVVSDNCSSDNTEEVVKGFNDPRIRYFRQSANIGANNNFNYCLEKAQGVYFLLFHDDDAIDADFIDICMRSAGCRTDIGLIRTGARVIDGEGNTKIEYQNLSEGDPLEDLFFSWFSGKAPLYLCNSLFNTAGLRDIGGFRSKTNLYQDVVAEFKLAARHGRIDIPDVKASFRRHLNNMGSASKVNDWCADSLYLLEVMCDLVPFNKDLIRKKGMVYFARKNYRLALTIKSPFKRFATYGMVYKTFGYRYSPIQFVLSRRGSRLRGFLRRKLEAVSSA